MLPLASNAGFAASIGSNNSMGSAQGRPGATSPSEPDPGSTYAKTVAPSERSIESRPHTWRSELNRLAQPPVEGEGQDRASILGGQLVKGTLDEEEADVPMGLEADEPEETLGGIWERPEEHGAFHDPPGEPEDDFWFS